MLDYSFIGKERDEGRVYRHRRNHLAPSDGVACGGGRQARILVESEVCARGMVVAEVTAQTPAEVSLVEDDNVIEDFAANGAYHALDERVLPGRAGRGENSSMPIPLTRCRNSAP